MNAGSKKAWGKMIHQKELNQFKIKILNKKFYNNYMNNEYILYGM